VGLEMADVYSIEKGCETCIASMINEGMQVADMYQSQEVVKNSNHGGPK
jgi:hypothetical protein